MRPLPHAFAAALPVRYRLGDPIAEGGQAIVVAAHDATLHRDVALKVLPRADASAVAVGRFQREIALLAELAHPYIVPILDAGEAAGVLWFAMPLIRSRTLAERLAEGPIPEATLRRWGAELADALAAAHRRGVVHRDVKPANIHIVDDHALLADFGVASLGNDDELTATGEAVGTHRYMAPEQREGDVDPAVDVYGLGATLIEASTGKRWTPEAPPWDAVSRTLRPALQRAVSERPTRWASAEAFGAALTAPPRARWPRRVAIAGAAGAVLAAMVWSATPAPASRRFATDLVVTAVGGDALADRLTRATITRLEWFPPLAVAPWHAAGIEQAQWRVESALESSSRGSEAVLTVRHASGRTAVLRVPGDSSDLPRWASAAAESLVTVVAPERHLEFQSYAGGAHSGPALWLFYDAEVAFDREAWDEADSLFRAAEALDHGFVQARWWAMQSRKWARLPFDDDLTALAATKALPPPYDSLVALQREPDLRRRIEGLDALARQWPRVAEVQLTRANELFHRGPLVGRSLESALTALESAAATFPALDRPVVWDHVVWGAVRLGDRARAKAALAARRRGAPSPDIWGLLLRYANEVRFRPPVGRALEMGLRLTGDGTKRTVGQAFRLALTLDIPDAEVRLGNWIDAPSAPPSSRASVWAARAVSAVLEGRPLAAVRALDSAAVSDPSSAELRAQRWEWRLLLPAAGVPMPGAEQQRARDALAELATVRARFALAVNAIDDGRARELATPRPGGQLSLVGGLLEGVARFPEGLAIAPAQVPSALYLQLSDSTAFADGPFARALGYLWLARGLLMAGDTTGAVRALGWSENADLLGWPTAAPQSGEVDAALSAVARWRQGGLLIATGRVAEGCRLRNRARELWRTAEPSFLDAMQRGEPSTWERACPR